MHSALVRVQNVFGFFTTVAFTVAIVIALSSFVSPQSPNASIQLRNVQVVKGRPHYYSYKKEEYAHIKFDLDAGTLPPTPPLVAICTDNHKHRSEHPLQLEHQASLPLPQSHLPIQPRLRTRLRSHHLGRHHRRRLRPLAHKPLRAPGPKIQTPQEIQKGRRRSETQGNLTIPGRRTASREPAPKVPDHRHHGQAGQQDRCYTRVGLERAAVGWRADMGQLGEDWRVEGAQGWTERGV